MALRRLLGVLCSKSRAAEQVQLEPNLVLRHQVTILCRQVKRPVYSRRDRALLAAPPCRVGIASAAGGEGLLSAQFLRPDTSTRLPAIGSSSARLRASPRGMSRILTRRGRSLGVQCKPGVIDELDLNRQLHLVLHGCFLNELRLRPEVAGQRSRSSLGTRPGTSGRSVLPSSLTALAVPRSGRNDHILLFEQDERVGRQLVLLVLVEVVHADALELALAEQLERLSLG
jgi:hypothetical protein